MKTSFFIWPIAVVSIIYRLPRLKYRRKIIAGPERRIKASEVSWAITFQLIILLNNL